MLELRKGRTPRERMFSAAPYPLLSLWTTGSDSEKLSGVFGKREEKIVDRVAATSSCSETRNSATVQEVGSYGAFDDSMKRRPLQYLKVFIGKELLLGLVDTGSNRTLLGIEGIEIIREVGLPITGGGISRIRLADGKITTIKESATVEIELRGEKRELTVGMMPDLAVPAILGMDFLSSFGLSIDFARRDWSFAKNSIVRYPFVDEDGREEVCCGILELGAEEEDRLQKFLTTVTEAVSEDVGVTSLTEHRIEVGTTTPIRQRCYLVSPKVQEAIREEVDRMLKAGIIEPSCSEWANPIVMVKKPNGKYRFCIDFRKVNNVSKKDAYPLPNMTGILDKLRSARYISTIDLSQAYHQIPLAKESREITAFSVPGKGHYQFTRMPYGLTGAPATFQRLLDRLIGPEMEPHAFAYLDDIVIVTKTFDEHLEWLSRVLDKIKTAGLTINPEKSKFCRSEVKYLGFLVHQDGLKVDNEKVQPVLEYPPPKNIKQLRRFLGMASWYRRFLSNFATVSEPLTQLLKKKRKWEWEEEQKIAFEKIRESLATAPVLSCPDFKIPFILQTDASNVGLGAVLTQTIDDTERVIAYASRALTDAERKYSTTELECLAVVWAIKKFRPYLEGYHFTVVTDHSSLRWLHNLSNPTGRLARWALELLEYEYEIVHRKGALHHVPDALSRIPEENAPEIPLTAATLDEMGRTEDRWYRKRYNDVLGNPRRFPTWKIIEEKLYFLRPRKIVSELVEDIDRWKLVLPLELRREALVEAHDQTQAGHLGVEKTYYRLAVAYYWPKMFRDVTAYVRQCDTCQRTKVEQQAPAGLMGRRIVEKPWTTVAADIMGPLPRSKAGHSYLLVIQDLFSKWVECRALRAANGKLIREALEDLVISRWGTPKVLVTDNGTEFNNKILENFAKENKIEHSTVPPYHPQANPVERVNRILKTMIVAFLDKDHREWDVNLKNFRFAYNTAHHSSIGASPAFINFGRELEPAISLRRRIEGGNATVEPGDLTQWSDRQKKLVPLLEWVKENIEQAYQTQASRYNLRRRLHNFKVGDLILKRQHVLSSAAQHIAAKLVPKFHGPFRISKMLSSTVCELVQLDGSKIGKVHVQDIKPYVTREDEVESADNINEEML